MTCSKEAFLNACEDNNLQVVRDLLAGGVDPNSRDEDHQSAVNSLQISALLLLQFSFLSFNQITTDP